MDLRQFWEIVRDLAIAVVIMMLMPLFLERGVALFAQTTTEQAILIRQIFGALILIAGTFVESPALGIGLIAGGFFAMPRIFYSIFFLDYNLKFLVILTVVVSALIRALIGWDKQYLETLYKD